MEQQNTKYVMDIKEAKELYLDSPPPLKTGFKELDDLLEGGVKPHYKYLFYGEAGTGKTRILKSIVENQDWDSEKAIIVMPPTNMPIKLENIGSNMKLYIVRTIEDTIRILRINLFSIKSRYRLIAIDRIDEIISSSKNPLVDGYTILNIVGQFLYKFDSSFIAFSGVYQTVGKTEVIKPKIPNPLITLFNRYYYLSKFDKRVRIYDQLTRKSAIIKL